MPTVRKRGAPRPAKPETYVRVAHKLLRSTPGGEVSAGQVAYHVHGKNPQAWMMESVADRVLSESDQFQRANFINSNQFGVTTWRAKSADKRG